MLMRSVFILLTALLLISCTRPATFSRDISNVDYLAEVDPNFACEGVLQQLKAAKGVVSQIGDFTWREFAAIGVVLPPPGVCATGTTYLAERSSVPGGLSWMPLTEKLSFRATIDNIAGACDRCLVIAEQVCFSNKKLSSDERQELWYQLESSLTGAIYFVLSHKNTLVYQVFPETDSQFGRSSDDVRKKYGDKFKSRCDQYLALLAGLLYHLDKAKQMVSNLHGERDEVHR